MPLPLYPVDTGKMMDINPGKDHQKAFLIRRAFCFKGE